MKKIFSHKDTETQRKNIMLFKTHPNTQKEYLTQRHVGHKEIICLNKKNKLRRCVVGSVPSVAPCDNNGFTLIEIIVAILIFGILSSILFSTLIQIQRRTSRSKWRNELTEEGVKISNIIRLELTGARELYFADEDSVSFLSQDGKMNSFYYRDSVLFRSGKRLISEGTKVTYFKFIYYLPSDFIGESSEPVYSFPVNLIDLEKMKVIDWKFELQKGITSINLKSGVFIRNIRQR